MAKFQREESKRVGVSQSLWWPRRAVRTAVTSVVVLAALMGCKSNDAVTGDSGNQLMDAAAVGSLVRGDPQPCTEAHSICINAKFPASLTAQPTKLQIDLYIIVPPMDPPDGIPLLIPNPSLVPGETVQLRMTDLGLAGKYHFLGVVFMPGGGFAIPVSGVDYTGDSASAYDFSGSALNIPETLNFQPAP